ISRGGRESDTSRPERRLHGRLVDTRVPAMEALVRNSRTRPAGAVQAQGAGHPGGACESTIWATMVPMPGNPPLTLFSHGRTGPVVVALPGGPGAPGSAATWARELSTSFRVLEPLQRGSGDGPLSVARHVAVLHDLIARRGGDPPALVGHSWGALLALAF